MNSNERTLRSRNFLNEGVRGCVAVALSLLLIPYGMPSLFAQDAPPPPPPQGNYPPAQQGGYPPAQQGNYPPQQGNYPPQGNYPQQQGNYPPQQGGYAPPPSNYAPLGAPQLNQLVAPIALYPDSLVAQILTAATYPQQVSDANNWMMQTGGMPPDQRAAAADQMPWDPSIKALTAFPSVLDNMARNYNWTGALGNAYYNQPGDVMNAVQAMRMRAQAAGTLRSDAHYRVAYDGGLVVIEPMNPALVYVPYYNPWGVWGVPISPWGGYYWGGPPRGVVIAGFGLGFAAVGISIALFSHYGWGYRNWAPNWRGGVVVYNHTTYISRSTTVINRGNFGGYNRGVYEHAGPGVPQNFRPPVTSQSAAFHSGPGTFRGSNYSTGRPPVPTTGTAGRQYGQPAQPVRPPTTQSTQGPRQFGQQGTQGSYSRPQSPTSPTRPTTSTGTSPQVNRPTGTTPHAPQTSAPTHQAPPAPAAPSRAPAASSSVAPTHEHSGGGTQHSAPRKEEKR